MRPFAVSRSASRVGRSARSPVRSSARAPVARDDPETRKDRSCPNGSTHPSSYSPSASVTVSRSSGATINRTARQHLSREAAEQEGDLSQRPGRALGEDHHRGPGIVLERHVASRRRARRTVRVEPSRARHRSRSRGRLAPRLGLLLAEELDGLEERPRPDSPRRDRERRVLRLLPRAHRDAKHAIVELEIVPRDERRAMRRELDGSRHAR